MGNSNNIGEPPLSRRDFFRFGGGFNNLNARTGTSIEINYDDAVMLMESRVEDIINNKSQELFKMNNNDRINRIHSDMENIGFLNIKNLGIHFWKYGFSNNQNNPSHYYDKNLKIGLCGDSFSIGKVDGSIISADVLSKKILGSS